MRARVMIHARMCRKKSDRSAGTYKSGQKRADCRQTIQEIMLMHKGMGHNFIFAPESRQRRNPGDGEGADQEQLMGPGNLVVRARPSLRMSCSPDTGMDHRAGRQEEQGLKKRMRHQMEDRGGIGADAAGQKHIAQLADGGIGQHPLNIGLNQSDGRGE